MTGTVVISLDCEGKWGMADRSVESLAFIDNPKLIDTYIRILDTFERFQAKATFGFVAALCLDSEFLRSELAGVDHLRYRGRNWLSSALTSLENGYSDGWACPRLVREVTSRSGHHVCTHSGTHIPYSDTETSAEAVTWDLNFARKVHAENELEWGQIIFPRNVIGHLQAVGENGVTAYRDVDRQERRRGRAGKLARLFHELASLDAKDFERRAAAGPNGLIPLSAAKFLSAGIGIRRRIPVSATLRRIEVLLTYAARTGNTVHFYTHPHNFISDRGMFVKLERLLYVAKMLEASHGLRISTMKEEENALRCASRIQG